MRKNELNLVEINGGIEIIGTTNLVKAHLAVFTAQGGDEAYNLLHMRENTVINHANNSVIWYC